MTKAQSIKQNMFLEITKGHFLIAMNKDKHTSVDKKTIKQMCWGLPQPTSPLA